MGGVGPGSAREEAERLVATVLGAVRLAADGARSGGSWGPIGETFSSVLNHTPKAGGSDSGGSPSFATGSPECCVCPVCRAITMMRDPDPEFAERLAAGAGDLAAGVASLLRAFADDRAPNSGAPESVPTRSDGAETDADAAVTPTPDASGPTPGDVWRQATRSGHDCPSPTGPAGQTEAAYGLHPDPVTDPAAPAVPAVAGEPPSAAAGTRPAVPASRESSEAPVARPADGD